MGFRCLRGGFPAAPELHMGGSAGLREACRRLRRPAGGSGRLREASGRLQEASGRLWEASRRLWEASRKLPEASRRLREASGRPPGGSEGLRMHGKTSGRIINPPNVYIYIYVYTLARTCALHAQCTLGRAGTRRSAAETIPHPPTPPATQPPAPTPPASPERARPCARTVHESTERAHGMDGAVASRSSKHPKPKWLWKA